MIAVSSSALSGFCLRPPAVAVQEDSFKPRVFALVSGTAGALEPRLASFPGIEVSRTIGIECHLGSILLLHVGRRTNRSPFRNLGSGTPRPEPRRGGETDRRPFRKPFHKYHSTIIVRR